MIAREGFEIRAYKQSEELHVAYHATGLSKPDYKFVDGESLQVKARIYGSINWIGASLQSLDEEADIPTPITAAVQLGRLRNCFSAAQQHCQSYPTGEDCTAACQQTLFAGHKRGLVYGELSYAKIDPCEAAQYTNGFFFIAANALAHNRSSGTDDDEAALEPHLHGYDIFQASLNETTTGRRLFTTQDCYVGLAPAGSLVGDGVCGVLGCNVPFVVRGVEGSHDRGLKGRHGFVMVGECYVHGLMRGEALLRCAEGGFEYVTLR